MQQKKRIVIRNGTIVTEQGSLLQGELLLDGRMIEQIGCLGIFDGLTGSVQCVDAHGGWLLPGFIDVHVHGGFGHDFMDANADAYDTITHFHAKNGTTGMLATTVTASREAVESVLCAVRQYQQTGGPGSELLGVHLEGPFISPKWPGAQNPDFIVPPNQEWLQSWVTDYPHLIQLVTLAPETDGALDMIKRLTQVGIVVACGHTDAGYDTIEKAVGYGLSHAIHTFNAMKGLHHREPGTVGAVLSDPRISAEIIADGHHVHPACIRLLTQVKTKDNLILITDAISASGLGDGEYKLGGLEVIVKEGVARLKEGDSLAGSTLTMIDAFRFVIANTDLTVPEVSRLVSWNPAKLLGIEKLTGSISEGKRADLVLLTPDLHIRNVFINGHPFI
jgi:N-acetylglucosamine-6-phosphate deacetylase